MISHGCAGSATFMWRCLTAITLATDQFVLAGERTDHAEIYVEDQASLNEPLVLPLGHEGLHHRHVRAADDSAGEGQLDILQDVHIPEDLIRYRIRSFYPEVTKILEDPKRYYETVKVHFDGTWVDLDALSGNNATSLPSEVNGHANITLSFPFPFFGTDVTNVTIVKGGFLYTGEYVHPSLAATKYIAPLMANFDPSHGRIRYIDNGTALTVEWANVRLQASTMIETPISRHDESLSPTAWGPYTFQATISMNGDIVFAYRSVPLVISTIRDWEHPVKVGLSDAYIYDRATFVLSRKMIYEYHRVNLKDTEIADRTAIYFRAMPTCFHKKSCFACQDQEYQRVGCLWCPAQNLCSDGVDRNRPRWLSGNCNREFIGSRDVQFGTHGQHLDIRTDCAPPIPDTSPEEPHTNKELEMDAANTGCGVTCLWNALIAAATLTLFF